MITLSLGIAANTATLSLVNAWLLRPLPVTEPQSLVSVWRTAPANPREPAYFDFYRDYLIWAAENHTLESLAALFPQDYTITGSGQPQQIHGAISTWNLFATVALRRPRGARFVPTTRMGSLRASSVTGFGRPTLGPRRRSLDNRSN